MWQESGEVLEEELILFRKPQYKLGLKKHNKRLDNKLIKDLHKQGLKTNFLVKGIIDKEGKFIDITVSPEIDAVFHGKIIQYFKNISDLTPAIIANMKVNYPIEVPVIFN